MKYAILITEGNHDQACVERVLTKFLCFQKFDGTCGEINNSFWNKNARVIPTYPSDNAKYHSRLDTPSILSYQEEISIAIFVAGGNRRKLIQRLVGIVEVLAVRESLQELIAVGLIVDSDKSSPNEVAKGYRAILLDAFRKTEIPGFLANFPDRPGAIDTSNPRSGIYVLPNNQQEGTLDTLLCQCGDVVYPTYVQRARRYLSEFAEAECKEEPLKWKPFDGDKALVATVVSVLKPGMANTPSIAQNDWIGEETRAIFSDFANFLQQLLGLP